MSSLFVGEMWLGREEVARCMYVMQSPACHHDVRQTQYSPTKLQILPGAFDVVGRLVGRGLARSSQGKSLRVEVLNRLCGLSGSTWIRPGCRLGWPWLDELLCEAPRLR